MKQVITLAQLQGAMAQNGYTAEQILSQYDCPEYAQALAAQATPTVAVAGAVVGAGAAFDLMAFAATKAPTAGRNDRVPAWEATIEDLRSRVIIRDVQTPNKKDEANAKLRIQLAPQYVGLSAYGTMQDGSPIVHFVVPRANEEQAKAKLLADVASGMHDVELKAAAEKCKLSSEKKKANALNKKKAPQDTQAAADALAALETASVAPVVLGGTEAAPLEAQFDAAMGGIQLGGGIELPTL